MVSNLVGAIISSNAVLIVNTNPVAPVFISQPSSQIALAGTTVNFGAAAAGTAPISYQWSKDSVAIPGATSSTLSLTNVQTAADGSYVLSGGDPMIIDAESNTTTQGHSLTFYVASDTILIGAQDGAKTLTKHRVEK